MNSEFAPSKEFERLLVGAAEGELTDDHRERLNDLVGRDADARDYYVQYMTTHAMLNWRHGKTPELNVSIVDDQDASAKRDYLSWGVSVAVAASLLFGLAWAAWRAVIHKDPIATVIGAEFIDTLDGTSFTEGDTMRSGEIEIRAGTLKVELNTGVIIAMRGPVKMKLTEANAAHLTRGVIRAYVAPKARGFTLSTANLQIVDLGTEFGVAVDEHNNVQVHVFKGKVKMNNLQVNAGQAQHVQRRDKKGNVFKRPRVIDVKLNDKNFPSM